MTLNLRQLSNSENFHEDNLLEAIAGARKIIPDVTYPGEDQPLSWHLDRLEEAILNGDLEIVREYGSSAIHFPYTLVVQIYLDSIDK